MGLGASRARAEGAPPTAASAPAEHYPGGPPTKEQLKKYNFSPTEACPYCGITPAHPQGRYGLHWHDHWRKVGLFEYIATPVLLAVAGGIELFAPKQTHPYWTGPILFDKKAQEIMVYGKRSSRKTAETISNITAYASVGYPYLIDDLLVTTIIRKSPDVGWQMFVINTQAYAMTFALVTAVKHAAGRERPFGRECVGNQDIGNGYSCNSSTRYQSFYSGHAALTATSAGLVCTHHTQLRLYENPYGDTAACLGAIALWATTGALRMTSNVHWATDVIVGDLMGFASGYLVPTLLYYKEFHIVPPPPEQPTTPPKPRIAVLPVAAPGLLQLAAFGQF